MDVFVEAEIVQPLKACVSGKKEEITPGSVLPIRLIFSLLSFPGILVVSKVEPTGLGGSLNVWFMCSGCEKRSLMFQRSAFVEGSKRTVIGLALAVVFFLFGHRLANFNRTLRQYLGILCITKNRYYDVIKLAYPHLKNILDEMCKEEKKTCKNYHKINWVAGHELSLLLMSVKRCFLYLVWFPDSLY